MTGKAGLKAGLIGAAIILVMTLLSQIPGVGCICCGLTWLVYAGIGVLAGFFLTPPRAAGTGAGAGAIAGLVSGAAGGIVWIIVMAVTVALGGTGDVASVIDPQTMRQLIELGIDPEMFVSAHKRWVKSPPHKRQTVVCYRPNGAAEKTRRAQ